MAITTVIKRDGSTENYNPEKIINAIQKANKEVEPNEQASVEQMKVILYDLEHDLERSLGNK